MEAAGRGRLVSSLTPVGQSLCRGIPDGPDFDTDKIVLTILARSAAPAYGGYRYSLFFARSSR